MTNTKAELEVACELKIDLSRLQFESNRLGVIRRNGTTTTYHTTLKIVLELDWDRLEASIWWQGKELTRSPVIY